MNRKQIRKAEWRAYEEVAQYLLNEFAEIFGLGAVEGKQIVRGFSGAEWEIDAKGLLDAGKAFIIVECRRHTTSRLKQAAIASIAGVIEDTGAAGGIVVSPLPLQEGAKKLAAHKGIHNVILDPESTTTEYIMEFLNRVFTGVRSGFVLSDTPVAEVIPPKREH